MSSDRAVWHGPARTLDGFHALALVACGEELDPAVAVDAVRAVFTEPAAGLIVDETRHVAAVTGAGFCEALNVTLDRWHAIDGAPPVVVPGVWVAVLRASCSRCGRRTKAGRMRYRFDAWTGTGWWVCGYRRTCAQRARAKARQR